MEGFLTAIQDVDPLWSVALAALAAVVLLSAKLGFASAGRAIALGIALVVLAGAGAAGYYGYWHFEETRRLEERRALDERLALLFSQTIQPDSVFACLDGSPAPTMREACERSLFSEPQRVAAAVAIVTQRIALLSDALKFASLRDPSYVERIGSLRDSIEADAYGFVGYVFSLNPACTHEVCDRFQLLRNAAQVKENIRVRRFEAFMAKHAPSWRGSSEEPVAQPRGNEQVSGPTVTLGEQVGAPVVTDPMSAGVVAAPPAPAGAAEPAAAAETAPAASPAAPTSPPAPVARPQPDAKAKSAQPAAKGTAPTAAAKSAPRAGAKAKVDPVERRSSEPTPGLPRVVPGDYAKDKGGEPTAQAAGEPGAPIQIGPLQQNFFGR